MVRMTLARDVVLSFNEWFQTRNDALFDRIFLILKSSTDSDVAATTDRCLNTVIATSLCTIISLTHSSTWLSPISVSRPSSSRSSVTATTTIISSHASSS
ncbi:hypothetical protein TB2_002620 [Malus domestica]